MEWVAVAAVLLVVMLAVVKWRSSSLEPSDYPYRMNEAFLSPAERSFLCVLDQTVGTQYRVMGKVRVADIIHVVPMKNRSQWRSAFNRISAKHFDFVLCDKDSLTPIAVIELEGKTQGTAHRRQRDDFLSAVCEAASLPLLRAPARVVYTRSDIQRLVVNALSRRADDAESSNEREQTAPTVGASPKAAAPRVAVTSPACPKCSSFMSLGEVKGGARAGEKLWACNHYPRCRGIVAMSAHKPEKQRITSTCYT